MSTTIGSVVLDSDMIWNDEFHNTDIIAEATATIGGGVHIQEFTKPEKGRHITLQSTDGQGYQKKSTVEALRAIAASVGATYAFRITHNGLTFSATVRFRNEASEEGAVVFDMAHVCDGLQSDNFWYSGTIYLMSWV